jgi:hypothetical protein
MVLGQLTLMLLFGCGSGGSGENSQMDESTVTENPSEVGFQAIELLGEEARGVQQGAEVRDFKIRWEEQAPLTSADRANGLSEKWCVSVSYAVNYPIVGSWQDATGTVLVTKSEASQYPYKARVYPAGLSDRRSIDYEKRFWECMHGE